MRGSSDRRPGRGRALRAPAPLASSQRRDAGLTRRGPACSRRPRMSRSVIARRLERRQADAAEARRLPRLSGCGRGSRCGLLTGRGAARWCRLLRRGRADLALARRCADGDGSMLRVSGMLRCSKPTGAQRRRLIRCSRARRDDRSAADGKNDRVLVDAPARLGTSRNPDLAGRQTPEALPRCAVTGPRAGGAAADDQKGGGLAHLARWSRKTRDSRLRCGEGAVRGPALLELLRVRR